jgi:hypothetical protein
LLWRNGIPGGGEKGHQTEENNRLESENAGVHFGHRKD